MKEGKEGGQGEGRKRKEGKWIFDRGEREYIAYMLYGKLPCC